mmetsp:Transcript_55836/g.92972  ORF Transcript_55836/g.92972 Transcript_55836/m.92972 type:complete len:209 (+) Transcript_55836:253-879(+)
MNLHTRINKMPRAREMLHLLHIHFAEVHVLDIGRRIDPFMRHHLLCAQTLLHVQRQQLLDEVFGGLAHIVPVRRREAILSEFDEFIQSFLVALRVEEGRKPAQQHVDNDAQTPHVRLAIVRLAAQHFGRHIMRSATRRRQWPMRGVARQPKIDNHDVGGGVLGQIHEVVRLQIAMNEVLGVHILDTRQHLIGQHQHRLERKFTRAKIE